MHKISSLERSHGQITTGQNLQLRIRGYNGHNSLLASLDSISEETSNLSDVHSDLRDDEDTGSLDVMTGEIDVIVSTDQY